MLRRLLILLTVVSVAAITLKVTGVLDPAPQDPVSEVVDLSFALQKRLEELREEVGFPGATASFILEDGRSGRIAVGVIDPGGDEAMPLSARMLAGSVGKMFVAGVVLDLVGRGVLDLDAPVTDWLGDEPWFSRLPNGPDLTLRNLMNHVSGIPDHLEQEGYLTDARALSAPGGDPDAVIQPLQAVGYVLDLEPLGPVGGDFSYADTNYILAGLVVEKATGRTYYDLLTERLLEPLGLVETSPQIGRDLPGLVHGHMHAENIFGLPALTHGDDGLLTHNPVLEWCGGGVVSTANDLARYAHLLYRGQALDWDYRPDLLKGVPLKNYDVPGLYGLATFMLKGDLGTTLGHTGWYPGYHTAVTHYVDHGITVAVQVNRDWETDVRRLADELAYVIVGD